MENCPAIARADRAGLRCAPVEKEVGQGRLTHGTVLHGYAGLHRGVQCLRDGRSHQPDGGAARPAWHWMACRFAWKRRRKFPPRAWPAPSRKLPARSRDVPSPMRGVVGASRFRPWPDDAWLSSESRRTPRLADRRSPRSVPHSGCPPAARRPCRRVDRREWRVRRSRPR
jgi:hypothetical protein